MATINPANLSEDFTSLFPGAGGALLKGSGLADRLAKDIASQSQPPRGFIAAGRQVLQDSGRLDDPPPLAPTRGINGPPAVNAGIQNTPAPITQLQDNPSGVPNTPQIPQTPVSPAPLNLPSGPQGISNSAPPLAGGGTSPFLDELKKRLRPQGQQF